MSDAQLVSKRTSHWRSGLRGPNPRKRLGRPRLTRRSTLPQSGVAPVVCAANATPARYRIHHADQRRSLTVPRAITHGSCIPCPVGIRSCAREYLGTHTEPVCSRRCLRRRRIGLPSSPVRTRWDTPSTSRPARNVDQTCYRRPCSLRHVIRLELGVGTAADLDPAIAMRGLIDLT